jgi:hypothetical protein
VFGWHCRQESGETFGLRIVSRVPARTWRLPPPWQDSQETFLGLPSSPFSSSRACVASWKPEVMLAWHFTQLSEPTKVAPAIWGGIRSERWVTTQETSSADHPATRPKSRALEGGRKRKAMG